MTNWNKPMSVGAFYFCLMVFMAVGPLILVLVLWGLKAIGLGLTP
jgi:hypothetical protein